MSTNSRLLNTCYGPYRTEQAIRRAQNADFILLPTSDSDINAVHPIPIDWLRDELIPRQREDVRMHINSLLNNWGRLSTNFIEALNETLANLDIFQTRNCGRRSSFQSSDPLRNAGSPSNVHFADVDELTHNLENLGTTTPIRGSAGNVRHTRDWSWAVNDDGDNVPPLPTISPNGDTSRRGHVRSMSANATMVLSSPSAHPHRQPSPNRDELVAIEVHLNEVENQIEGNTYRPGVFNQCREGIAAAHAFITRSRTSSYVTREDIDTARTMVETVRSVAADRGLPARRLLPPPHNPSPSPPQSVRSHGHRHALSDVPVRMTLNRRAAAEQEDETRQIAHMYGLIPLFRTEPVEPMEWDGLLLPDHEVLVFQRGCGWLRYHEPYVPGLTRDVYYRHRPRD
jgi:hypothetical protein